MTRQISLTLALVASGLCSQTVSPIADQQQLQQQARLLQMLIQMQQSGAPQPPAQPGLSPAQIQQIMQALNASGRQDPAATAQPGHPASSVRQNSAAILVRQASKTIELAPRVRESVFVKTKTNDMAEALKAQVLGRAIDLGAAAAARKVAGTTVYISEVSSVMRHLPFGGGGKQQGWEFDFLRGLSAETQLGPGGIEFVLPPTAALPGAAGLTFEPVVVKLRQMENDKVRIIAARKVTLSPRTPTAFSAGAQEPFERETLSSEFQTVAVEVQRNADGTSLVKVTSALAPGEYALVLQKPEPKTLRLLDSVVDFKVAN